MRPSHPTAPPAEPGESDQVILLDEDGAPCGVMDRAVVHSSTTPLHLAFSVLVLDGSGRLLLTRRALAKRTWPGVWTGSCCGHPRPGEEMSGAARRRTREELGLELEELRLVLPQFRYRAVDAGGVVENEVCPVHVAFTRDEPVVDPEEVAEVAWVDWSDVHEAARRTPFAFSPWLVSQLDQLGPTAPGRTS